MRKFRKFIPAILLIAVLALVIERPAGAQNVGSSAGFNMFSNVVTLQTATTNPVNAIAIPLRKDQGFSLFATFNQTNANSASLVWFFLSVSPDGTNWSTTTIPLAATGNGTTKVVAYSNYPPSLINNAQYVKITSITNGPALNATNQVHVTNVVLSYF